MSGLWARVRRQAAFARHVPVRQIGWRAWLEVVRRAELAWQPRSRDLQRPALSASPPLPVFAPRQSGVVRTDDAWIFKFLGRVVEMGPTIDWSAPSLAGRDQLWRMNLHYMEYLEHADDAVFAEAVRQWIAGNPPYTRSSYSDAWNAYALSLRVVVWMQQLASRPSLPADLREVANSSLRRQLFYLARHLEADIGGNHLIKNIKALLWGSAYFTGPDAERWRRIGLRLLAQELGRQILPDGMHFELSTSYHCQVLADLIEIRHALGAGCLAGTLDHAIARATQVAADIAHPDGKVALFGDAGLHMAYAPSECLDACQRVLGQRPAPRAVFALEDAGYYGARDGADFLMVDAGRLAPDSLPGHGHGDMLSFEWSLDGNRIFVDQGVFEYVAGPLRLQSRSARSHNTVSIAGADQAEFFGAFRMGRRVRPLVEHYRTDEDGFELTAMHDGFVSEKRPRGPRHRRSISAQKHRLRIVDELLGDPDCVACSALLLAPEVDVVTQAGGGLVLRRGRVIVTVQSDLPLRTEPGVWWPDMGQEQATRRIVMPFPAHVKRAVIEVTARLEGEQVH